MYSCVLASIYLTGRGSGGGMVRRSRGGEMGRWSGGILFCANMWLKIGEINKKLYIN